jgi:hypothetical protein
MSPSRAHRRAARATARYLDPRRAWSAAEDRALRAHLAACLPCRAHHRRALGLHRALTSGDPAQPTGFETARRRDVLLEGLGAPAPRRAAWWRPALAPLAAAAAVLLIALGAPAPKGTSGAARPELQARGAAAASPLTGLGVTGVSEAGDEYEVVASGRAEQGDWLRFTYSNERPHLRHLFVFGLQAGQPPAWFAPMPEEGESLAITTGRFLSLGFESRVAARTVPGPLTLVALFTPAPVRLSDVAQALGGLRPLTPAALEHLLRERLALPAAAQVQIQQTGVYAPEHRWPEEAPHAP